jgi:glutaredoxin 3
MREQTPLFLLPYSIGFQGGAIMAQKVIIYGKAGCPFTDKAKSAYKTAEYFDVKQDPVKLEEMLKYSKGVRKVPVIVGGGKVSIGYGGS